MCSPNNKKNICSSFISSSGSNSSDLSAETHVPFVAKCWLTIYESIPPVNAPFFTKNDFNISFTLVGILFLTGCRFIAEYLLVKFWGWPENATATKEAAANCGSICHSTLLCTGLVVAFATTQKYDVAARLDSQTTATGSRWRTQFADTLLQFCTGYMIYDVLINVLWVRWKPTLSLFKFELNNDDVLYLLHHFMTSFYMTSARVIGAGYQSAMICMLLGELTNPLQNMYLIGENAKTTDCCYSPEAQQLHYAITVAFAAMYNLIRVIVAPPFFAGVTYSLLLTKRGRTNVPLPLNIFWNFLIWAVCFGSFSWISKCHYILMDFLAAQQQRMNKEEL